MMMDRCGRHPPLSKTPKPRATSVIVVIPAPSLPTP
jgi:hypothetical protein